MSAPTNLSQPNGILVVNKPSGMTSRSAVNHVQRAISPQGNRKQTRAGHAGTLDPLASGVLVLCLGKATRLIRYVQSQRKTYEATFRLGCSSPSDDLETEITSLDNPSIPGEQQINSILPQFLGQIEQRPPTYSAVQLGGKRAYKLARKGERFEVPPRTVEIIDLTILNYTYPLLTVRIVCGSGTYIRSLGRDIGKELGSAAVMSALTRTAIGPFQIAQSVPPLGLSLERIAEHLLPPLAALSELPHLEVNELQVEALRNGLGISIPREMKAVDRDAFPEEMCAVDSDGNLISIVVPREGDSYWPRRNFL